MIESKQTPERVPDDSPDRCQGMAAGNQCTFKKEEGSDYCHIHGGGAAKLKARKQNLYDLDRTDFLVKLQSKVGRYSDETYKYDLSEELGIMRIMLENVLNKCQTSDDLLKHNQTINVTIERIQKLANDTLKLDSKIGTLMSQEQVLEIAQTLINIVGTYINNTDQLTEIAVKFEKAILEIENNK